MSDVKPRTREDSSAAAREAVGIGLFNIKTKRCTRSSRAVIDHPCTTLRSLLMPNTRPCHAQGRHDHPAPQAACTRVAQALVTATPTQATQRQELCSLRRRCGSIPWSPDAVKYSAGGRSMSIGRSGQLGLQGRPTSAQHPPRSTHRTPHFLRKALSASRPAEPILLVLLAYMYGPQCRK